MKFKKIISKPFCNKKASDIASQLLSRGLVIVLSVIGTIFLRRNNSTHQYGEYLYLVNYLMLLLSFADLGTHLTLVREASISEKQSNNYVIGTFLLCRIFLISVISVLGLILPQFTYFPPSLTKLIPLIVFLFITLSLKDVLAAIYHSIEKLGATSIIHGVSIIISFASIIFVVFHKSPIANIFVIQAVLMIVLILPVFISLLQNKTIKIRLEFSEVIKFLKQSFPLGMTLIVFTVYSRIDTIMIEKFYSVEEVGIYGLSYKIYDNLVLPAAFILNALLSDISKQADQDISKLKKTIKKTFIILLMISALIIVVIFVAAPTIINIIIGRFSAPETYILRVLSFATLFAYLNHLTGYLIVALKLQAKALKIAFIALSINVVLNWYLLPRIGYYISAHVTIFTELVVLFGTSFIIIKQLRQIQKYD